MHPDEGRGPHGRDPLAHGEREEISAQLEMRGKSRPKCGRAVCSYCICALHTTPTGSAVDVVCRPHHALHTAQCVRQHLLPEGAE